jgi:virginiamycin B lyase
VSSNGVPFFAEFGSNRIASIDPATMEIHEYILPNTDSRPRRVAITRGDVIWYTDISRGYLGRFDPKTGKTSEWPSPGGPRSAPQAIAVIGSTVWYSETGVKPNTLIRFEPALEKFQTWVIPSGGGVVRNMTVTRQGNLWLGCGDVNKISFVEVKSGGGISGAQ